MSRPLHSGQQDISEEQAGCLGRLFKSSRAPSFRPSKTRKSESTIGFKQAHKSEFEVNDEEYTGLYSHFSPCCDYSYGDKSEWWPTTIEEPPSYVKLDPSSPPTTSEVTKTIEAKLDDLNARLRELSLKIHDHPELAFKEKIAHNILTEFMAQHGFSVTKHYLGLETAWRAEFTQGKGGRVLGINSEMDAVPGIGHACGHNLIAVSGLGVAIAVKEALQDHNVPGKVVLLGTPAEEGGGGKAILLDRGGYNDMNACIMCHPSPGPAHSASVGKSIAMQGIEVEYFGHAAHAGAAPWEGTNALDAAFLAYSGVSVLRQQMKPDHRVHGVIHGKNWVANVIPDYANMRWFVRAPTYPELVDFRQRVKACFEAAAIATSCKMELKFDVPYYEIHQNDVLAEEFAGVIEERYGMVATATGTSASSDFGNVTYALPALHPNYAIPTSPGGSNHTPEFATAARAKAAHEATMTVTKALAITGFRVLSDDAFARDVKHSFDSWRKS